MQMTQDESETESEPHVVGDAADTALYNLCTDRDLVDINKVRDNNPRLQVLPFNSSNKFMISANQLESSGQSTEEKDQIVLITLKGAPDIVIERGSTYKMNNDQTKTLDNDMKNILLTRQEYDDMMEKYQARKQQSSEEEDLNGFPRNDYCFIGLFSLLDPPRTEAPDAVLKARQAQIRIATVTGDHPITAKSIAKQVNILTSEIANDNGFDTFKLETDSNGQSIINLYRNDKVIEKHEPSEVKSADNQLEQTTTETDEKESWYKHAYFSCRNQFKEAESNNDLKKKIRIHSICCSC